MAAGAIALACSNLAFADVFRVSVESAGALNTTSTFSSVGVETFDSAGPQESGGFTASFANTLGSFTPLSGFSASINKAVIRPGADYGGADGTRFITTSDTGTMTVNLSSAINYFGLWISSMNDGNVISFYSGDTFLYSFNTQSLNALITSAYNGNPSGPFAGQNSGQPYAFVNYYNASGTFDKIVLSGDGFESDNWTAGFYSLLSGTFPGAPNSLATLQQINLNAASLRSLINNQSAALQAALSYDCKVFDQKNICVSVGGRYTYAGEGDLSNLGGMLTLAYRPNPQTKLGVFIDQSLESVSRGSISQRKKNPTFGFFGSWAKNTDGNGLNIRASAALSSNSLAIVREESILAESAKGKTSLNGEAYELRVSYIEPVGHSLMAVPYAGLRYTRVAMGGYSEPLGNDTEWPIRYNGMAQKSRSVVVGVNLLLGITENLSAHLGLGAQKNQSYTMDNYAGTSDIPGVTSFSVPMATKDSLLTMANVGASYEVSKTERFDLSLQWHQHPSYSRGTSSLLAAWSIGF